MYSLSQKIRQLFIVGLTGSSLKENDIFADLCKDGIGGAIFFTQNIVSKEQFQNLIKEIKEISLLSPFLSIDQEGGRVERTENIHNGKKYLSAKNAAQKGLDFIKEQTANLCDELLSFGINMNFAPVLDTNTNPKNPIIGVRAYGDNADDVIKYSIPVINIHKEKGIVPVGKHFPGHGDTSSDSHIEMPVVRLSQEEMERTHLKPFRYAVAKGLDVIMAAHVYYSCYDEKPVQASLSKNVLTLLLREKLGFNGLILSDDMVMGAVLKEDITEIYAKGLKAGINTFLYRNSDERLIKILQAIEGKAKNDTELLNSIENSFKKVVELKQKYNIL